MPIDRKLKAARRTTPPPEFMREETALELSMPHKTATYLRARRRQAPARTRSGVLLPRRPLAPRRPYCRPPRDGRARAGRLGRVDWCSVVELARERLVSTIARQREAADEAEQDAAFGFDRSFFAKEQPRSPPRESSELEVEELYTPFASFLRTPSFTARLSPAARTPPARSPMPPAEPPSLVVVLAAASEPGADVAADCALSAGQRTIAAEPAAPTEPARSRVAALRDALEEAEREATATAAVEASVTLGTAGARAARWAPAGTAAPPSALSPAACPQPPDARGTARSSNSSSSSNNSDSNSSSSSNRKSNSTLILARLSALKRTRSKIRNSAWRRNRHRQIRWMRAGKRT
mmetsp:Transcript_22621/g.52473  ORF Transcript_22621/g.52473 Transcript_22621/m.52473 type:complete len:352 (+) Transcript_22621:962-2017(+)